MTESKRRRRKQALPESGIDRLFAGLVEAREEASRAGPAAPRPASTRIRERTPAAERGRREEAEPGELLGGVDLAKVVEEARKQPTVAVYSPLAAGILLAVAASEGVSMNSIAREILEAGLKRRYPDLAREVERLLGPPRRVRRPRVLRVSK